MVGGVEIEVSAVENEAREVLETDDAERAFVSRRVRRGRGISSMIMLRSRKRGPGWTHSGWTKGQIPLKKEAVERGRVQLQRDQSGTSCRRRRMAAVSASRAWAGAVPGARAGSGGVEVAYWGQAWAWT